MSADPRMALVILLLAGVFLVLLIARAVVAGRRRPRITRWHREPARPEGAP